MTLADLKAGDSGIILKVKGRGAFRNRIMEMGFVKGKLVKVTKKAPLQDPVEYEIMQYQVSLRHSESSLIEVTPKNTQNTVIHDNGIISSEELKVSENDKGNIIEIALIGNPNSGKTSVFNNASGLKEHTGNYTGVTVDSKTGTIKHAGYIFKITDLPGTYSLSAYSQEEVHVRQHVLKNFPDITVNVIDATNLERNLFLTTQLIDMDIKVVIALNMFDEFQLRGDVFDYEKFGILLGVPVIPTVGTKGKGINELLNKIIQVFEDQDKIVRHIHINYGEEIEKSIKRLQDLIWHQKSFTDELSSRFYAIKLLEKDKEAEKDLSALSNYQEILQTNDKEIGRIEGLYHEDTEVLITDARYGFIAGALKETYQTSKKPDRQKSTTKKIDFYLTHKYLGFPVFLIFLWLMFQGTFSLGAYPGHWIDHFIFWFGQKIYILLPDSILRDFISDGIIHGVGGVLVFLPNILLLFFFISLMEDTGYMARAAFITDKLMHLIGLHGKSFIPLIMGFGCNVPAIMATRTLKSRSDRLLTILIMPFMSCSARLPVYILIAGAVFPNHAGNVIFSVYIIGILLSVIVAILFKHTLFKEKETPFVMELPPYRIPGYKSVLFNMWSKSLMYLKKMGGVILIASIIIWALGYFPRNIKYSKDYDQLKSIVYKKHNHGTDVIQSGSHQLNNLSDIEIKKALSQIEVEKENEKLQKSFIGYIGRAVEPLIRPLGFDWKIGISLITGAIAKEIVVSSMGVLYNAGKDVNEHNQSLRSKIAGQTWVEGPRIGQPIFTRAVAYAFMLFVLLYMPCTATVSMVKRETGSWKWPLFLMFYTTFIAWLVAFFVNQIGNLL